MDDSDNSPSKILGGKKHQEIGVDVKISLKWSLNEENGAVWTGFVWCKMGTSGRRAMNLLVPQN